MTSKRISFTLDNSNTLATLFTTQSEEDPLGYRTKTNLDESANFLQVGRIVLPGALREPKNPINLASRNIVQPLSKSKFIQKGQKYKNKAVKNQQKITFYKPIKRRITPSKLSQNAFQSRQPLPCNVPMIEIFDWMMEAAGLMKMTKDAFYHAVLILYKANKLDKAVGHPNNIEKLTCAALTIAMKFDSGELNYLEAIHQICCRKVKKEDIFQSQLTLHKIFRWKIPSANWLIESNQELLANWKAHLERKNPEQNKSLYQGLSLQKSESNVSQLHFLHLLDVILLQKPQLLDNRQIQLAQLISLYVTVSFQRGDIYLQDTVNESLIKKFMIECLKLSEVQSAQHFKTIFHLCYQLKIIQLMSTITQQIATLNLGKLDKVGTRQYYLPLFNKTG